MPLQQQYDLPQAPPTYSPTTWNQILLEVEQNLTGISTVVTGPLHPTTPTGLGQSGALFMGSGAPSNSNGNNGDYYFRTDTPGTANQRLYVKSAGSWTGIV